MITTHDGVMSVLNIDRVVTFSMVADLEQYDLERHHYDVIIWHMTSSYVNRAGYMNI